MEGFVWLIAGYIIGAYLMRRHMLREIRARATREVIRAMPSTNAGCCAALPIRPPAPNSGTSGR